LLKIQIDEKSSTREKLQIGNFEKVVKDFDGQAVNQWFQQIAEAYELTLKEMYVQGRGKMVGSAKLFLQSVFVSDYNEMKSVLLEEFVSSLKSLIASCKSE